MLVDVFVELIEHAVLVLQLLVDHQSCLVELRGTLRNLLQLKVLLLEQQSLEKEEQQKRERRERRTSTSTARTTHQTAPPQPTQWNSMRIGTERLRFPSRSTQRKKERKKSPAWTETRETGAPERERPLNRVRRSLQHSLQHLPPSLKVSADRKEPTQPRAVRLLGCRKPTTQKEREK